MRGISIPNRILTLLLGGESRRWHSRAFLVAGLAVVLIALAIGALQGISQACIGPTNASNVAGPAPGSAIEARPYLGITYVPITAHMASYYGLATSSGLLITDVAPGSPAQRAGIQADDIITEFDDLALSNDVTIIDVLNQREVGQNVEIGIVRNGEQRKIEVALGARPGN